MAARRSKRDATNSSTKAKTTKTKSSSTEITTTDTKTTSPKTVNKLSNLSPPQFFAVVSLTLAITHTLDLHAHVTSSPEIETHYCSRFFKNHYDSLAAQNDPTYAAPCTTNDTAAITLRYHSSVCRILLSIIVAVSSWNVDPLLRIWNTVYVCCPIATTVLGMWWRGGDIEHHEVYALGCLLVFGLVSNYKRGAMKPMTKVYLMEGMHNVVLFGIAVGMSYVVVDHLMREGEVMGGALKDGDGGKGFSDGAKATWFLMVFVDYMFWTVAAMFSFIFFDEERKRGLLFAISILALIHAFYHLPAQKDYWNDAPQRQTIIVGLSVVTFVGGVLPPFDKFVVKR